MCKMNIDCDSPRWEWDKRWNPACELFAVKYKDVGIVSLWPSIETKSGSNLFPSFSLQQEVMKSIVIAESQEEPQEVSS